MGARTATLVADDESVRGVVALAPWFPAGHPVDALSGKHLVAAHGRADRVTSYAATEQYVARAGSIAASVRLIDVGDDAEHYMLQDLRRWNIVAAQHTIDLLTHS